jgi:hypothetical protein
MSFRGTRFLVFALFSVACARSSKEAGAPGQPAADESVLASEQAPAATPAPPPAAPEEAPASTRDKDEDRESALRDAVSDFDRARLELSQLIGRDLGQPPEPSAPAAGAAASPKKEAPPSRRAPADTAASHAEGEDSKARALKKGDDGCVNVCRAFESLSRSAAAVCRLDDGERCKKASAVVAVARDDTSVKACACKK